MRPLTELINEAESSLPFVTDCANKVPGRCELLPPSATAGDVLYRTQVTTRSPMGGIAYHTGGIIILGGWLRILGSGSPQIPRSLPDWNLDKAQGFYLIADDAFGGFFAIDGGSLRHAQGRICYFAPDSLRWEPLDMGYSDFLLWACTDFRGFYDALAWSDCSSAISSLPPDRCLFFYPPLWSAERVIPPSEIRHVPVTETWNFQMRMACQLDQSAN
jgi:hypothetical protein